MEIGSSRQVIDHAPRKNLLLKQHFNPVHGLSNMAMFDHPQVSSEFIITCVLDKTLGDTMSLSVLLGSPLEPFLQLG